MPTTFVPYRLKIARLTAHRLSHLSRMSLLERANPMHSEYAGKPAQALERDPGTELGWGRDFSMRQGRRVGLPFSTIHGLTTR